MYSQFWFAKATIRCLVTQNPIDQQFKTVSNLEEISIILLKYLSTKTMRPIIEDLLRKRFTNKTCVNYYKSR